MDGCNLSHPSRFLPLLPFVHPQARGLRVGNLLPFTAPSISQQFPDSTLLLRLRTSTAVMDQLHQFHHPRRIQVLFPLVILLLSFLSSGTQGFLLFPSSILSSAPSRNIRLPQRASPCSSRNLPSTSSRLLPFYPASLSSSLSFDPSRFVRPQTQSLAASSSSPEEEGNNENTAEESAAIWGLTDLGNSNFGKFGSEQDPHRNIRPQFLDGRGAPWKEGADFLPELMEIKMRIQGVNVYLVGMPGSGKTTLGRMLAEGLQYRWMDLDQFIEQKLGKAATKVFEEDGEEVWRKQETLGMGALQTYVQTVVSTGGGIMQRKENLPFLHSGLIVWLDLPPEGIVARMQSSGEIEKRPLLKAASDPVQAVRSLYEERKGNYALADVRVVLRGEDDAVKCLKRVAHRIIEELDLRPPKAKMWEEKRNKMKNLWETMKAKGSMTDINEVPAEEGGENPTIGAIKALNRDSKGKGEGKKDWGGKADKRGQKKKGFGGAVRKGGEGSSQEGRQESAPETAAVGSQGVGFGLGLEEYMKGEEGKRKEGEDGEVAEAA